MTPDDLAAIKARADAAPPQPCGCPVYSSAADVPALLAEVERLRAALTADALNLGALSVAAMERQHVEAEVARLRAVVAKVERYSDPTWCNCADTLRAALAEHTGEAS
jgi:hypothetical protein